MNLQMKLSVMILAAIFLLTGFRAGVASAAEGVVDWDNRSIVATGYGVPTTGTFGAQARILARRAAVADAYRQLAETIKGVQVDSDTNVELAMTESDNIRLRVNTLIKGARVIDEAFNGEEYRVTMMIPMFGSGGLASAVIEKPREIEPFQKPQISASVKVKIRGGYTGVVIDCRGLGLERAMSPVIENSRGQKLYGHENIDPVKVNNDGMADYARNMSEASRAGDNPLVLKAESLDGINPVNPVISVDDGNLMLAENQNSNFLDETAVVFLYE